MCDICAYSQSVTAHPMTTPPGTSTPPYAPVPWRRPPEPVAREGRVDRGWNFAMDWHVIIPEPADPAAPPTPADLAFDRLAERVRGVLRGRGERTGRKG